MTVVFGCFLTTADAWIIEAQRGKNAGGRNRCPERIPRLPRAALVRCDVLAENRNRRAAHGPHKIAWRPQVTLALADPPERRDSRAFLLHAPRCPAPGCGHTHANNRPTRDWFCCEVCGYEGHADVVGAINVSQGRILPVEPPKRIRRRVGKRKPVEERVSHGA